MNPTHLLIFGVLRSKIAARHLKLEIEVGQAVKKIRPPRRGIVHNRGHGSVTVEARVAAGSCKYSQGDGGQKRLDSPAMCSLIGILHKGIRLHVRVCAKYQEMQLDFL